MKYPVLIPNIFDHPFTYESSLKLNQGDYVNVPFGKKTITGVIWNQFESNVKKKFELLNIDVEGHEHEVLKGFNFNDFQPSIITVEIHVKKTKEIFETQTYKILNKNKFELISHYYQTSFFKHKDSNI